MTKSRSGLFNDKRAYKHCCSTPTPTPTPTPTIVISTSLSSDSNDLNLIFIGSATGPEITDKGVVWNTTENPSLTNGTIISAGSGSGNINIMFTVEEENIYYYARTYAITPGGIVYGAVLSTYAVICLAKGTLITLDDLSTKLIENIDYNDKLLVWNFDDGIFSSANPLWIKRSETTNAYNLLKFSDGSFLKTINQHRIFNIEKGSFTYPMTDDTPIGTTTFNSAGKFITLISKEKITETVDYYNIISNYHLNIFANEILTSCRLNNMYPIDNNMTFVKSTHPRFIPLDAYENISAIYYDGLRLAEQLLPIAEINKYVNRLYKLSK
jgi:hypothetical protein